MTRRPRRKKAVPPMPGHSDETAAHRIIGRAFAKFGQESAPAYPGDKKDQNLGQERLDPLEEHEREMRQLELKEAAEKDAKRRAAEAAKKDSDKDDKEGKDPKPEDFYFSP